MKRVLWILSLVLFISACTVKELAEPQTGKFYPAEVTARIDDNQHSSYTKAYVDADLKVLWENDDRITLFNNYTFNKEYRFAGNTGANSGVFKEVSSGDIVVGNELENVYAVYPYQESTEISNSGIITLNLPAEQHYKESSFGRGANTMVSATTNTELLFKNLCGYLVLKLYGDNVSVASLSIKGNNNEALAGAADVTAPIGSTPSLSFRSSGTLDELTLVCDTPVELGATAAEASVFWLVVPPTTFTNGFMLTVTDQDGNIFEKSATFDFEIERNKTFRMEALEVEIIAPQQNNVIYYTSTDGNVVTPYDENVFGANIVSNTYKNGVGQIVFDAAVTSVGKSAFYFCSSLKTITLPEGTTTVGPSAFFYCSGLTTITMSNRVSTIGENAFMYCKELTSIELSNGLTSIGPRAFAGCNSLSSMILPDGLETIGESAFNSCSSISSIVLPASLRTLGQTAFESCSNLNEIYIQSSFSADYGPFKSCPATKSFYVDNLSTWLGISGLNHITSCGWYRLIINDSELNTLNCQDFPNGVSLSVGCFQDCQSITNVSFVHSGITSIPRYAFAYCGNLKSISIEWGCNVSSIGDNAFYGCGITYLNMGGTVTSIGDSAFENNPLNTVECIRMHASNPPVLGNRVFYGSTGSIYIYSNFEAYCEDTTWAPYRDRLVDGSYSD